MDIDSIGPGEDFREILRSWVHSSDVLLALIGPNWIDAKDPKTGQRRLDNPNDFVRIEITEALARDIPVVPVLLDGAPMPDAESLPSNMRALPRRNALFVDFRTSKVDVDRLANKIKGATERARSEGSGSSPQQVRQARRAEETANWHVISPRVNARAIRDHLAKFPGGVTEPNARAALESVAWKELGPAPTLAALKEFVAEFPDGHHSAEARTALASLAWKELGRVPTVAALKEFLAQFPVGNHPVEARAALERMQQTEAWAVATSANTLTAFENYLWEWPKGEHAPTARARVTQYYRRLAEAKAATTQAARWALLVAIAAGTVAIAAGAVVSVGVIASMVADRMQTHRACDRRADTKRPEDQPAETKSDPENHPANGGIAKKKADHEAPADQLPPGRVFRDCPNVCPEMVVLPAKEFMMASSASETGRDANEGPQRKVTIQRPFAVAKFEVTFAE